MLDGMLVGGIMALTVFLLVRHARKRPAGGGCGCGNCTLNEACSGSEEERCAE